MGAVGWVVLGAPLAGGQTTGPVTASFTTPGTSSYTVPTGICQVTVDARGAAAGDAMGLIPAAARAAIQAHLVPADSSTAATPPPGFGSAAGGVHAAVDTGAGGPADRDLESSVPDGGTPDGGSGGTGDANGAGGGGSVG